MSRGKITAEGMLRTGTPVEDYRKRYGLWVKREDLACPRPGPPFSKTRGVYAHVKRRKEKLIGVLDTRHSQAGHAVARACQILGKQCLNYFPNYKGEPGPKDPQRRARKLGATLRPLPAGRSCILFHQAKKDCEERGGYMMPNALKLDESVEETAKEARWGLGHIDTVIIPASSATIAAGVIRGFLDYDRMPEFIIHLGYSRSEAEVRKYVSKKSGVESYNGLVRVVDEGYEYKDRAIGDEVPPWPCDPYYDLKTFQWFLNANEDFGETLFWNIG